MKLFYTEDEAISEKLIFSIGQLYFTRKDFDLLKSPAVTSAKVMSMTKVYHTNYVRVEFFKGSELILTVYAMEKFQNEVKNLIIGMLNEN